LRVPATNDPHWATAGYRGCPSDFRGLGHLLVSLRIAKGISQRELARRLYIHESQVSRDERNEYFGITLERAIRVLDALNVRL
jgi:transcriptional regulator with XRE-family HTH domain